MSQSSYFPKVNPFYKSLRGFAPPVLFIDNMEGYVAIDLSTAERKRDDISYGNAKYCMGFSVYSNDESIGIGIMKDSEIYSLIDVSLSDFFNVSFEGGYAESSIICAIQVDYNIMYIGASMMYNDKAIYAGKTISAQSLSISLRSRILFSSITNEDIDEYNTYFDENGSSSHQTDVPGPGNTVVTFETYSGSTGFSDVSRMLNVSEKTDSSALILLNLALTDLESVAPGFTKLQDTISIDSAESNGHIYIISTSINSIQVASSSGDIFVPENKTFKTASCINKFDNVYQGKIFIKPKKDWANRKNLSRIFSPFGVFFRYNSVDCATIFLPGDVGKMNFFSIFINDSGTINWDRCIDSEGKIIPTGSIQNVGACDDVVYTLAGNDIYMNTEHGGSIASVGETKFFADANYSSSGVTGIKSMSLYIPYTDTRN